MHLPWKGFVTRLSLPISEGWNGKSYNKKETTLLRLSTGHDTKGTEKQSSDTQQILVVKSIGTVQIVVFWFVK
jgi:hypothetical protein